MKKCWKKLILFALMLVAAVVVGKGNVKAATIIDSGSCGDNATYTLDSDGVLTISGSGKISDYAFAYRIGGAPNYDYYLDIKKVIIEQGVTKIGSAAFEGCSEMTSVTMLDGVMSIDSYAFSRCSGLTSITIPKGVKSIGYYAFYGCRSLKKIKVAEENKYYNSKDECNAIIETKTNTLIRGCESTVIPDNVTVIEKGAFSGCSGLTSITIPKGVKSIGYAAFSGCSGLTSITMSDGVTSIEDRAFADCSSLTSITILNKNVIIADDAIRDYRDYCETRTIYGYSGSTAETYAAKYGITFKVINPIDDLGTTKLTTKNTTIKLSKTSYTYDGKAKKPTVKVLNSKGKVLKSSNYTVKYSNNVKAGIATVTIKFKGKYTGTIKATYTIKPKTTAITGATRNGSKVALIWKKQATQTSGYQIQYATDKKFTKDKQLVTASGAKKTSSTIKNVSEDKSYYFRIRTYKTVNGKKVYSAWSKVKLLKAEK